MERNYTLAHKYAQAFMRAFGHDLAIKDTKQLARLAKELKQSKDALLLADLTQKASAKAHDSMVSLLDQFGASPLFGRLVQLLSCHSRLSLLPQVLEAVIALYQEEHGVVPCLITSAQPLTDDQYRLLEQSIKRQVSPKKPYITYTLDKSLMGGVRIQIDLRIAEFSVAQHARRVRNALAEVYRGD